MNITPCRTKLSQNDKKRKVRFVWGPGRDVFLLNCILDARPWEFGESVHLDIVEKLNLPVTKLSCKRRYEHLIQIYKSRNTAILRKYTNSTSQDIKILKRLGGSLFVLIARMHRAPAAERNKEPILEKLKEILPSTTSKILEIASGTGQHVTHFAKTFKGVTWQPTEYDSNSLRSIQSYIDHEELENVKSPVIVDITKPIEEWPKEISKDGTYDAIYCANMIHISPWACSIGLFTSAPRLLTSTGLLITYGPYSMDGILTPESNIRFDQGLKAQNSEWGVRDMKDLILLAEANQLKFQQLFEMPANNKILVFNKIE